ncbi:ABC transporter substrate-binding protein [Nocardioides sambongensis]|uniref:ABC transporter substrate-binding protein n=1 Tax=Nocardioides sambongensis TaxID=2589074 RepID=UPI00112D6A36|nr:ABC transporter substrate-binding protein [Nocardioides sambongensis]
MTATLAACGGASGDSSSSGTVDPDGELRVNYPLGQTLDPHMAPEPAQLTIATWPVYDRLLQVAPDASYQPMLATEWSFSKDGKTLTLELRDDVTFSDGTPFDAAAVKANLEDSLAAEGTALQANVASIASVDVVDSDTVEIGLLKPTTTILNALASPMGGSMISPKALKGGDLATEPVGTGAYVIDSFVPGDEVVYTRRTDEGGIWDDKTGKPATISIKAMDPDAAVNALKSGQLNVMAWSGPLDQVQPQIDSGQITHTVLDGALPMLGIAFNQTMAPFDDPDVRKAVNLAIDRETIVGAFNPDNPARVQPWPEGVSGFDEAREDVYAYDPEAAKDLLAQAGHPDGLDAGELLVAQSSGIPEAAEAIQADLAKVGIDVKLRVVDIFSLIGEWAQGKSTAELMYMSVPTIDPYMWAQRLFVNPAWVPGGPDTTMAGLAEADLDDPSLSAEDLEAKADAVVDYATDQALYAPLYQGSGSVLAAPTVGGMDDLASFNGGPVDLRNAYVTE